MSALLWANGYVRRSGMIRKDMIGLMVSDTLGSAGSEGEAKTQINETLVGMGHHYNVVVLKWNKDPFRRSVRLTPEGYERSFEVRASL